MFKLSASVVVAGLVLGILVSAFFKMGWVIGLAALLVWMFWEGEAA